MAPACLLLLLLISSFVVVSTTEELEEEKYNKVKEGFKATGKMVLARIDDFRTVVIPFLNLIPVEGPLISAVVTLVLAPFSVANKYVNDESILNKLKFEFEAIHLKIDDYHVQHTWDVWASGAYYKPERDIEVAWISYSTLQQSLLEAKNKDEEQRHIDMFLEIYSAYEPATKTLYTLLTAKNRAFINSLGKMLAKHVNCHEKELREYNLFISKLICKSNIMNQFYYKHKNIESAARVEEEAKIAYACASAMFETHQYCLSNSLEYIKEDVKHLIDQKTSRDNLAKSVRTYLKEMYDSYDWMVVAFITKSSTHKIIELFNSHVLSGFTEVTSGKVTVAVTWQVKGKHSKASQVQEAVKNCVPSTVPCHKVAETLKKCKESVETIPVNQTYTAVHAFTRKSHDSHNTREAPNTLLSEEPPNSSEDTLDEVFSDPESSSDDTAFIYTGSCTKVPVIKMGKFIVLIKSDDELMNIDPCSKLQCGEDESKGKCVKLDNIFLATCQCNWPYYGRSCDQSIEDYKNDQLNTKPIDLEKIREKIRREQENIRHGPEVKDSRHRTQSQYPEESPSTHL